MNMKRIPETLMSMGYRPMDPDRTKWGKPLGNTLLLIRLPSMTLEQFFRDIEGTIRLWTSVPFAFIGTLEDANGAAKAVRSWVRSAETWQIRLGLDVAPSGTRAFEYLTSHDRVSLLMKGVGL